MKKVKIYMYILFLSSIVVFSMTLFSDNQILKMCVTVGNLLLWLLVMVRLEMLLFRPLQKSCLNENESSLEQLIAQETWSGGKEYVEILTKKIEEYIHDKISGVNIEMLRKKSEFSALQSQINPHFLYNTLETIRSQAITDGNRELAEMVEKLSSIFRYSISRKGEMVTLRDELNNIHNYMKIMEFRFYDRFALEIDIDDEDSRVYDMYIPRLILQPIVENAINHGLDETISGGIVRIDVVLTEDLIITVSDNGKGMSLYELDQLNQRIHSTDAFGKEAELHEQKGTGIALSNVNKRIQLLFGKKYGINIYSSEQCGTDVEITLPIIDKMENVTVGNNTIKNE